MALRAVLFVFDWDWKYLGHENIPNSVEELERMDPFLIHGLSQKLAMKHIPKEVKHVHMPLAILDADQEVTQTIIEEAKQVKEGNVSHTEAWTVGAFEVTLLREKKDMP